ncbi:MAG: hypothetical protein WA405_03935 [Candidatus Acidiferrales bacterium]
MRREKGKTPVLNADEARTLLDSIKIAKTTEDEEGAETEEPAIVGLRDRALIGVMVYTFARVNAGRPTPASRPGSETTPFVQPASPRP